MKPNADNDPAVRDLEDWVRRELFGPDDPRSQRKEAMEHTCGLCGARLTGLTAQQRDAHLATHVRVRHGFPAAADEVAAPAQ